MFLSASKPVMCILSSFDRYGTTAWSGLELGNRNYLGFFTPLSYVQASPSLAYVNRLGANCYSTVCNGAFKNGKIENFRIKPSKSKLVEMLESAHEF